MKIEFENGSKIANIDDEVIICPYCKMESEPCDFPDLNY